MDRCLVSSRRQAIRAGERDGIRDVTDRGVVATIYGGVYDPTPGWWGEAARGALVAYHLGVPWRWHALYYKAYGRGASAAVRVELAMMDEGQP